MAAGEVIVVDTRSYAPHHQGTQRIERLLEHWYKDLKANVVVSTDRDNFCFTLPQMTDNTIFTASFNVIGLRADLVALD